MSTLSQRTCALTLVAGLALAPLASHAVLPIIALMGKQMLKDMATSTLKSSLLGGMRDMGCKGTAMASTLDSLDGLTSLRGASGRGVPGTMGMMGMPAMPAGMPSMPMQMPAGMTLPAGAGMPGTPVLPGGQNDAMTAALMARVAPNGALPPGMALSPDQAASMSKMMAAMSAPLSPAETLATIDELAELGVLPRPVQAEMKECVNLLPQSAQVLGMGMGMMKTVIPQLREARAQMAALSPQEQDELAATLAQEFDKVPAADRKAMLAELNGGLFPQRVVDGLKRRVGDK